MSKHNERGHEVLDPTPMAIPVGFGRPESMESMIRRLVRTQLSMAASNHGMESFAEADDFDIPDDPVDPDSPWEHNFEPVRSINDDILEDAAKRRATKKKPAAEPPQAPPEGAEGDEGE